MRWVRGKLRDPAHFSFIDLVKNKSTAPPQSRMTSITMMARRHQRAPPKSPTPSETCTHRLLHSPRGQTGWDRRPSRHEVKASPSDHIAAPSRTTSFSRNCPTAPERAGKPPRLGSHPGVENKNESVVRNISTATALPIAHAFRDQGRRAINIAIEISTTPNAAANCRTVHTRYIQPNNGLCATTCASYPVNFIMPIQLMTSANP